MRQQLPPAFDILNPDGKEVIRSIESDPDVVLLIGSKISEWDPSNVPSGIEVTWQVAELLASQAADAGKKELLRYSKYLRRAPFEYILDKCPRLDTLRQFFSGIFRVSIPNSAHEAIASLLMSGQIHSVITPNYDLCLDAAIPDGTPLKRVVKSEDAQGLTRDSRVLFKIHGSAEAGLESTMILSLSEEGRLDDWKQSLLRKNLEGRTLLVMGFSALDFEISPYLMKSNPRRLIWNCYRNPAKVPETLTPNARRILSSCPSTVVWGDLRHVLAEMHEPFSWRNPSASISTVGQRISSQLSIIELKTWAASAFSSPGYARYAARIAEELMNSAAKDSEAYATAVFLRGDALYSQGRYLDTSRLTADASRIFSRHGNFPSYVLSEAKGVDALRCSGRFKSAYKRLERARQALVQAKPPNFEKLSAKLDLQEVLIVREKFSRSQVLHDFGWPGADPKMRAHQNEAKKLIRGVLDVSEKNGQWHDIQQCRMWAGRLKIPFNEVYHGSLDPLEDLAGWHHLGHMVPEMMSLRGSLLAERYHEAPADVVREHISIAKEIGCDPEVWKLTLALWKHHGWSFRDSQVKWLLAFARCQYASVMRIFKLLAEEYR